MAELTRERRRALRDQVQLYGFTKSGMKHAELLALFDAADERDRLREEKEMHARWARDLFEPLPPDIGEIVARSRKECA